MELDIKQYIFAAVRIFGAGAVTWLAAKGKISNDEATNTIVTIATIFTTLAWSIANKSRTKAKVVTALELPAGSTEETLNKNL